MADIEIEPRVSVFRIGPGRPYIQGFSYATVRSSFRGQTEAGRTEHMVVFTDGTPNGDAAAQAVLRTAEADYQAVANWFGGISLPPGQEGDDQTIPRTATPIEVLIDQQAGGAYHFGCDATDLYIEPNPDLASGFIVAELVEVFEAAANSTAPIMASTLDAATPELTWGFRVEPFSACSRSCGKWTGRR